MGGKSMFNLITFLIMCVGGINWLCIGLFQFDIIAGIFGSQANFVSRFLYMIIGLATVCSLIALPIKKGRIYEPKELPNAKKSDNKAAPASPNEQKNQNPTPEPAKEQQKKPIK